MPPKALKKKETGAVQTKTNPDRLTVASLPTDVWETIFAFTCNNPLDRPMECVDAGIQCKQCGLWKCCTSDMKASDINCKHCSKPRTQWRSYRLICCKRCGTLSCIHCNIAKTHTLLELRLFHSQLDQAMRDWVGHFNKWGREDVVFDEKAFSIAAFGFERGIAYPIHRKTVTKGDSSVDLSSSMMKAQRLAFALCGDRFKKVTISHYALNHIRFFNSEITVAVIMKGAQFQVRDNRFDLMKIPFPDAKNVEVALPWSTADLNARGVPQLTVPTNCEHITFSFPNIAEVNASELIRLTVLTRTSSATQHLDVNIAAGPSENSTSTQLSGVRVSNLNFYPAFNGAVNVQKQVVSHTYSAYYGTTSTTSTKIENPYPNEDNILSFKNLLSKLSPKTTTVIIYLDHITVSSWREYFSHFIDTIRKLNGLRILLHSDSHSVYADSKHSLTKYLESEEIKFSFMSRSLYFGTCEGVGEGDSGGSAAPQLR